MDTPHLFSEIEIDFKELFEILLFSLITAFVLSFNDWGYDVFDLRIGLLNLSKAFAIVFLSTSFVLLLLKYFGLKYGANVKFEMNWIATAISFSLAFVSYAIIPFPAIFNFRFKDDEKSRYGHHRIMVKFSYMQKIALMFFYFIFIILIILAYFFKNIYAFKYFVSLFFLILPIPHTPGFYVLLGGKESISSAIRQYFVLLVLFVILYFIFR